MTRVLFVLLVSFSVASVSEARKLPKKTDKYGITMIKIPAGSFMMGNSKPCSQESYTGTCKAEDDPFTKKIESSKPCTKKGLKCPGGTNEYPYHKVTLSSFWMAQTEVTQKQYYKVMGNNPSKYQSDQLGYRSENNPVENVNWHEAKRFCEKLGYRLPTEAEWEYAVRAGTTGDYYGSLNRIAWYQKNSNNQTHPVAKKSPNSFGLYDMSGNVSEWVNDWYGEDYYKVSPKNNPQGPRNGHSRVLRGGSFNFLSYFFRSSFRSLSLPDFRHYTYGFRCAQ